MYIYICMCIYIYIYYYIYIYIVYITFWCISDSTVQVMLVECFEKLNINNSSFTWCDAKACLLLLYVNLYFFFSVFNFRKVALPNYCSWFRCKVFNFSCKK